MAGFNWYGKRKKDGFYNIDRKTKKRMDNAFKPGVPKDIFGFSVRNSAGDFETEKNLGSLGNDETFRFKGKKNYYITTDVGLRFTRYKSLTTGKVYESGKDAFTKRIFHKDVRGMAYQYKQGYG